MTDEELDAATKGWRTHPDPQHEETFADTERKLRETITTLRAQLAEAHKDGSQLAAWQCLFEDGKTGIVCDDWGNQYCAMQRRADRAEAALAAQIEVDAGIALGHCYAIMSATDADARAALIHRAILTQPHDRTALDRVIAQTREVSEADKIAIRNKALREAYDSLFKHPGFIHTISGQKFRAAKLEDAAEAILALIEKPNAR